MISTNTVSSEQEKMEAFERLLELCSKNSLTPARQKQYEQARAASVARYSSNPLWIAKAKASGNEAEFWANFHPIGFPPLNED